MIPGLQVVNDTIIAAGKSYAEYSSHELSVRDAMFVLTCALPMLGSGLVLLARDGWWRQHERLSIQTVAAAWLTSITAVGIVTYLQHGVTTRATFIFAIMHEQIEVLLDCILLGVSARRSFAYAWTFGLVLLLSAIAVPSMASVFMIVAIIGGCNDALIALLFLYGKQYWFGLAALGHLASAIAVFTDFTRNTGVVTYNVIIFLAVWSHVGFLAWGIWTLEERHHEYKGPMANPLDGVHFSKRTLVGLGAAALASSVVVTLYLAYVFP